jgi:hypothetical protein
MNRNSVLTGLTALVLLVAGACDFNPSSPFQGFDEGQGGATLNGRFNGSATSSASTLRAQSAFASADELFAVIYDAQNVEIARVKVENGAFTLRGLPEAFTLVFVDASGTPVSERMSFAGVKPNQEVDIVVEMVGGEVVLVEEKRTGIDHDDLEIEGTARNIVVGSHPMTGSLEVNGYRVVTRVGETSIRKGNRSLTLEDLRSGDQVHVRGVRQSNGEIFAYEIKLQDPEEEETTDDKVTLCHIPPGNPSKKQTITVGASAVPAHLAHGDYLGACK